MADVKLTKNELRIQQIRLGQLLKYLPTLQLKKAMLQVEVNDARIEIERLEVEYAQKRTESEEWVALLSQRTSVDPRGATKVQRVRRRYENIAGVDVPYFEGVDFEAMHYSLFETPPWVDGVVSGLRRLAERRAEIEVVGEKKTALERELREVSIRVNLFEKILIPRARGNIKKIKVFLGDQELAAVSQAKVAKGKIIARKAEKMGALNAN
ncbi:V-type ATP synthase subunit D [Chlamydiales bacterium SCGC AG-110-P3]|nr:V-type ATP synthase subunit D [Chlamydiales bacterium SCGC AG-110-P3]